MYCTNRNHIKSLQYIPFIIGCLNVGALTAQQAPATATPQWRVGVGVAAEYMSGEAKVSIKPENPNTLSFLGTSNQYVGKQFQVAPSIELGADFKDYYLGLFISWRQSNLKATSVYDFRAAYYRFRHTYTIHSYADVLLKPGYKLTPQVMVYGLVGPSFASWSFNTDFFKISTVQREDSALLDRFTFKKNSIGLGLGAGFEYRMQPHYVLSCDYTYHFHRSKQSIHNIKYTEKISTKMGPFDLNNFGNLIRNINPSYSTFAVRLTYFFNLG
jgi:opacity protein-like surface antigen